MPEKTAYGHGARKLMSVSAPDPHDEFSQKAAENRKPPLGVGLTEKVDTKKKRTHHDTNGKPIKNETKIPPY